MAAKVILTITEGPLTGQTFVFEERTTCLMGREEDCDPRLPNDQGHRTISRHHCLLDINPPDVRVRDFGSLNGTFVNNVKIGQRPKDQRPEEVDHADFREVDLSDGDELRLGSTVFRLQQFVPTCCSSCGVELAGQTSIHLGPTPGVVWCAACHQKILQSPPTPHDAPPRPCLGCGRPLPSGGTGQRTGAVLCDACRHDPARIVECLLRPAPRGLAPQRVLTGYQVLRELGHGGMGAVYLAQHQTSGEQVALKIMLPQVAVTDRATADFLREAENTRVLHHPNVVELREVGSVEGTYFFTLEYCPGGSLRDRLKQHGGPLPLDEACGYILQALDGLQYAHTVTLQVRQADGTPRSVEGLVHRDVKPANLLLSGSSSVPLVKVSDFGLAKAFEQAGLSGMSRTGEVRGTVAFMPRQLVINFKYAQPAVDVWAAAASLYQLLTGTVPRDFAPGSDPFLTVLQRDAVPIRQRNPQIPRRLAEVIDHALVDRPAIGFQSALEFKQALEGVL